MKRCLLTIACLTLTCGPALGGVKLERKYTPGRTVVVEGESKVAQVLTIAGMDIETSSEGFFKVHSAIGEPRADGSIPVVQKFGRMQNFMSLPMGLEIQFDSMNADAKADDPNLQIVVDLLSAMSKAKWTLVVNKDKVSVEGIDEYVQSVEGPVKELLKAAMNSETLGQEAKQEDARFPAKEIEVGDSWDRSEVINLDSATLDLVKTYTYRGVVEKDGRKLHHLEAVADTATLNVPDNDLSPLKIKESKIKVKKAKWNVYFDNKLGEPALEDGIVHVAGDLKIDIMGNELPGAIDLKVETKGTTVAQ